MCSSSRLLGDDVGAAAFLYPFLDGGQQMAPDRMLADVATSIRQKGTDDECLRTRFADEQAALLIEAAVAIRERIETAAHSSPSATAARRPTPTIWSGTASRPRKAWDRFRPSRSRWNPPISARSPTTWGSNCCSCDN